MKLMDYAYGLIGFGSIVFFVIAVVSFLESLIEYIQKRRYVAEFVRVQTSLERREYNFLVRYITRIAKADFKRNYRNRLSIYDKYMEKRYVHKMVNSHTSSCKRELERSERKMSVVAIMKYNDAKRLNEITEG